MTLTFELLTLKRVTRVMGFRGLLVLDLGRGTGRTDRRLPSTLIAPSNYSVATMSISCTELRSVILTVFFLSPGDAVWPIALNFAWTERHCHACKTPRSMYPSIYNSFPVIRTTIAKNRHFTYPGLRFLFALGSPLWQSRKTLHKCKDNSVLAELLAAYTHLSSTLSQLFEPQVQKSSFSRTAAHIFCFPWRRPCDYHAICCMDRKIIQCLPNPSQHIPVYLQQFLSIFNSFWVIRCLSQCVSPKIAIFTTFLLPLGTPLRQSR